MSDFTLVVKTMWLRGTGWVRHQLTVFQPPWMIQRLLRPRQLQPLLSGFTGISG